MTRTTRRHNGYASTGSSSTSFLVRRRLHSSPQGTFPNAGPRNDPILCETGAVADDHFGEHVAERFDERYAHKAVPAVVDPIVAFIADLAGSGAALEFGVGTGRIALPLGQRGVPVHGIDLSEAMVARMRAKAGSDRVVATVGDFATTKVEGTFSVVYLVANTIMNLTTQDEQVECFRNAAAHLEPNGSFVIEVLVPRLQRLPSGETFPIMRGRLPASQ